MKEDCGCCDGIESATPVSECNPPGQSSLLYRAGTYATFYETMLARLSNLYLDIPNIDGTETARSYPLKGLTARDPSDPSIALLDAWAVVGDVLTFYQERIANEGYLPTALERRSITELARLVGYKMRPGVAASVYLAFTTATGFEGTLPAGTRAQSIPGTGEQPQFFETSDALYSRASWNAIKPRLTRPQFITQPETSNQAEVQAAVTDADVIDTVYLDGTATNLKTGDGILFLFGPKAGQQWLRTVESIEAQADDKRTEVAFVPSNDAGTSLQILDFLIEKATYLFPGSTLAEAVATILTNLKNNVTAKDAISVNVYGFVTTALAQLREQQAMAEKRQFSRVSTWIYHIVEVLPQIAAQLSDTKHGDNAVVAMPSALEASPLRTLYNLTARLALPQSAQPANSVRLGRSIARSFAPQSDIAPRLLAALKPAVADALYPAWRAVPTPADGVEVHAMRAKATLFAGRYTGPANPPPAYSAHHATGAVTTPTYTSAPTIANAWSAVGASDTLAPNALPLDAPYDQIKPGSWIAIDRPQVEENDYTRVTSYHLVTGVRTANMDSTTGYSANVTTLSLEPTWLGDLSSTDLGKVLISNAVLRNTIVYAQAERMTLTEEPVDTDVAGDTISLDAVYDGLDVGRWVIVSGNRTDIPNVSGVQASELAMLAGVSQGTEPPQCTVFPAGFTPFTQILYTTPANAQGDRLVVGTINPDFFATFDDFNALPLPVVKNQEYCQQVELAPGFYANAYVPNIYDRNGFFFEFVGLLVDPQTKRPLIGGVIPNTPEMEAGGPLSSWENQYDLPTYFAWRISQGKLHTSITLATPLAYTYDAASVCIYGNVVKATHGQSVGEVLGDGNSAKAYQTFATRQAPLTYVSAPTVSGTQSTLKVTVNEIEWHERDNLLLEAPRDRTFITRMGEDGKTQVVFGDGRHGARVPTGTANIKATYRYGIGAAGNVEAGQISQLASHPLGAQGVINPLAASGGADRDSADDGRANAPMEVMALDRLVSVKDYADFSRSYAGIGKATAAKLSDGRKQLVYVTVAGAGDIPIDPTSDLYTNLIQSLMDFGDPSLPVAVGVRRVKLLVMSMNVAILPDYQWEDVEPCIRAAMLAGFGFTARALGQSAYLSEAVRTIQEIEGVAYVDPQIFDGVGEDITAETLANLANTLKRCDAVAAELARPNPDATDLARRILPAELVFLSPAIADTLILTNIGAKGA